jgi:hypothetical protein
MCSTEATAPSTARGQNTRPTPFSLRSSVASASARRLKRASPEFVLIELCVPTRQLCDSELHCEHGLSVDPGERGLHLKRAAAEFTHKTCLCLRVSFATVLSDVELQY